MFSTDSGYKVKWANAVDEGSRVRRGDGLKADGTLSRASSVLCHVEIKPPCQMFCTNDFLSDYWKLANLAKDCIDNHLTYGRSIQKFASVQVFGTIFILCILRVPFIIKY